MENAESHPIEELSGHHSSEASDGDQDDSNKHTLTSRPSTYFDEKIHIPKTENVSIYIIYKSQPFYELNSKLYISIIPVGIVHCFINFTSWILNLN
jgi:hypothetical protein